jgi:hypothetical protein
MVAVARCAPTSFAVARTDQSTSTSLGAAGTGTRAASSRHRVAAADAAAAASGATAANAANAASSPRRVACEGGSCGVNARRVRV